MTTDHTPAPTHDLTADDPRTTFAQAVATAASTIAGVRFDQLANATPCDAFDVRNLLGHLVSVLGRVAAIGRQDDPFSVPEVTVGIGDDAWHAEWMSAAHQVQAAWDDAALERMVVLPWATMPGWATLAMYTSEVTVHTWDLAQATGQHPAWNDQVVAVSMEAMRQGLPDADRTAAFEAARANMPAGMEDFPPPFANAVTVMADAPAIDLLIAWTGRQPR